MTLSGNEEVPGSVNPVLQYLNLSPAQPARSPTTPAPRPRPPVTASPLTTTSKRLPASPTKASRRSHTTQRIPATGRRFPHFPSMEITDNHLDTGLRGRSSGGAGRRNEKKLFTTTPSPRQAGYNIHPLHKYQHFDTFPPSYGSSYNSLSAGSSRSNYPTQNQARKPALAAVTATPGSYDGVTRAGVGTQRTTQETFSSLVPNNKNNFFVDWGMKVDDINDIARKREIQSSQMAKSTNKPKIKVPEKLYHSQPQHE